LTNQPDPSRVRKRKRHGRGVGAVHHALELDDIEPVGGPDGGCQGLGVRDGIEGGGGAVRVRFALGLRHSRRGGLRRRVADEADDDGADAMLIATAATSAT
jgi:hypothetical protein